MVKIDVGRFCRQFFLAWIAMWFSLTCHAAVPLQPEEAPELDEVTDLIKRSSPPPGVLFVVREFDEEAFMWIVPRIEYYVYLLRNRFAGLPLAVVSHGDEMATLTSANRDEYLSVHKSIQQLVMELDVEFYICGAFAANIGLTYEDFPDYIEVAPFGPARITDYLSIGYEMISLELVW